MAAIGKIRSWGPWLVGIIGLALFGFIATDFTRQCETSSNQARQQVGKVLGEKLSIQDLQQRSEEYKALFGKDANEEFIRNLVWDDFVKNTVMEEEAEKLGLGVTDEEVKAVLAMPNHPALPRDFMPQDFFNQAGEFDYNNVAQIYSALQQQAPEQFRDFEAYWTMIEKMLRQNLLRQKYETLLQACMLSNEYSAKLVFDGTATTKNAELVAFPYTSINDNEVQVSEADLKAKYEEMKEMLKWNKETRDIKYVVCKVQPSDADMEALTNSLLEAAAQFDADSLKISNIVAMHRSTIAYSADRPYNKNGIRNISAALLDSLNNMKDSTVTAPFRFMSMRANKPVEYMAIARLNRRYQDIDSIRYQLVAVPGNSIEDATQRADSIIGVINAGTDIDTLITKMNLRSGEEWFSADSYQNGQTINADQKTIIAAIKSAKIGELQHIALTNAVLIAKVTERKMNTLYDVAIVSNEIAPSSETEDNTYNRFSAYVSSCSNAADLEKKAAEAGYEIVEQKNLLSDANTIGAPAPLANTRDAVKWAFAKAEEGSISEIYRDPAERRFLTVAVTKINPVGYLDIKGAEQLLRAEVIKDKKADMLMKKLEGVKTVEEATEKGGTSQTLNSVRFPATLPVMNMEEPGLDGAIAATAVGQNAKKPFKGQNGVYFYKVVSSESDSTRTFDRRAMEADLMRQQVWIVTPTKTDAAGNPRTDRSGRPMHVNPFTSFWDVLLEKAALTDSRYQF